MVLKPEGMCPMDQSQSIDTLESLAPRLVAMVNSYWITQYHGGNHCLRTLPNKRPGADGFQRPLVPRARFQPQLRPGVGRTTGAPRRNGYELRKR